MCGRYAITTAPEAMRRMFGYPEQPNFPPRYNVAPTQPIPIVRVAEGGRHFALVRWGLLPAWVKDPKAFTLLINGRSDTINEKPAFRNAMKRRRCLIPADGFYEWKRDGAVKRPFYIRRRGGGLVAFAGLWETWVGPNGEELDTAAIVTTDANAVLRPIHDRMPVILPEDAYAAWLDCTNVDAKEASRLLVPAPDDLMEAYEISPAVNRVANDGPDIQEPYTAPDAAAAPTPKPARKAKKDDRQQSLF
jgi:putative SOS response-associated peptidase YedK